MASLATKYRPTRLQDLVGQDGLVHALSHAIEANTIPHSIILTGIRGIGKTTTGRAIARSLLCESGPTVNPCMTCAQCQAINNDSHPDLIEIDAASNASVEAARNQMVGLGTRPMMGRWRIRIIDEAHGMSARAWDVYLKPIEEPPPNEIFIFATTEGQGIPATVRSRSHTYTLSPIGASTITERLHYIASQEHMTLETDAATLIARNAEGSMRDAISILEQARNQQQDRPITAEAIQSVLGIPGTAQIARILVAAGKDGNAGEAIQQMRTVFAAGAHPNGVLKTLMQCIYHARIAAQHPALLDSMGLSAAERHAILDVAQAPPARLAALWESVLRIIPTIKDSPLPQETLTMAVISGIG